MKPRVFGLPCVKVGWWTADSCQLGLAATVVQAAVASLHFLPSSAMAGVGRQCRLLRAVLHCNSVFDEAIRGQQVKQHLP